MHKMNQQTSFHTLTTVYSQAFTIGLQGMAEGWCVVHHGCPNGIHSLVCLWASGYLIPHGLFSAGLHQFPHQLCSTVCQFLRGVPAGKVLQEAH